MVEISTFDFARLATLKQYSDLEKQLCLVMKGSIGSDYETARIVFHQISNTRTRYAIIGKLITIRNQGQFTKGWERIERWLRPCDNARNQIVHWSDGTVTTIDFYQDGNDPDVCDHPVLRNPAAVGHGSPTHYERDLWLERDRIRVMMQIVNRFALTLLDGEKWPWAGIFKQPITAKTPVELLQILNDKGYPARLPPYDRKILSLTSQDED